MKPESLRTKFDRWFFNFFPAYRGTGARVIHISSDWQEVKVKIPLSWRTRNYVKTIYGGSMYGGVDPIYMLMWMNILGKDYIVWDKAATIGFKKPGNQTLYACFKIEDSEIEEVRKKLQTEKSIDLIYRVDLQDESGLLYAEIDKTIYLRKK